MKQFAWLLIGTALMLLLIPACTDPTEIGADLLDGDAAEVGFSDTLSLKMKTVEGDSVLTYFPVQRAADALQSYLVGDMNDPIFGNAKAEIFAHLSLTQFEPDFDLQGIDSVVLVLPLDTNNVYGNRLEEYELSVHRVTEDMNPFQNYFSTASFASEDTPLGTLRFLPNFENMTIVDYAQAFADTIEVAPQLRIPMPIRLGSELLGLDTIFYQSDSAFLDHFKGIHIKSSIENAGLMSLDLISSDAGLYVYYKTGAQLFNVQYRFQFNPFYARVVHMETDASGAFIEPYIEDENRSDSLVFVQGMDGVNVRLEIPFIENFEDIVVNKAELEVRVAEDLPGDNIRVFTPASQLMLLHPLEDGELVPIDDILLLQNQGQETLNEAYGGVPLDDEDPVLYRMNMTSHFQGIIDGRNKNELYLSVFDEARRGGRVPLFGKKHPLYSIKLKIAFTRL